jgi:hypothetical protein
MIRNVGQVDRAMRALAAIPLTLCALLAPLPLSIRVGVLGGTAVYLLFTVIAGTCFGYRLLGRSTCPADGAPRS